MVKQKYNPKSQIIAEIHKPVRRNYKRRKVILKGISDLFQSDLCVLANYARYNKGYKYILIVIDCFSKFLWTRALKTKSATEVRDAILDIFSSEKPKFLPKNFQTDQGTEYYNKKLKSVFTKYGINHYSTFTIMKSNFAERVIRTIKNIIFRTFHLNGNYNWIDSISKITMTYNKTRHSTTGMRPIDVFRGPKKIERLLLQTVYNDPKRIYKLPKFSLGDIVRISKLRSVFSKGYTAGWTTELFRIGSIKYTNPITYNIIDMDGNDIRGAFYETEIQKTKEPEVYLVEKILRRKAGKVLVKFLGLDSSKNSWIEDKNLIN